MSNASQQIVNKAWNFAHVLRDDGLPYMAYTEQSDRAVFYAALQAVRAQGMDLTGWLEFFASGLAAQMEEVKARGTAAIRRDLLVREHRLNERQGRAIEFLMGSPQMAIADFEALCPDVSRRSLQRDLAALEAKGLIWHEGETNQLVYKPTGKV